MSEIQPATLFPWDDLMGLGLGLLRLPPEQFWSMTPLELKAASEAILGQGSLTPIARSEFTNMMLHFPDQNNTKDESNKK